MAINASELYYTTVRRIPVDTRTICLVGSDRDSHVRQGSGDFLARLTICQVLERLAKVRTTARPKVKSLIWNGPSLQSKQPLTSHPPPAAGLPSASALHPSQLS